MMFRAVLCVLALGINTAGAFQAARRWVAPATTRMSTNDLYVGDARKFPPRRVAARTQVLPREGGGNGAH